MSTASPTFSQLKAQVATIHQKVPQARVIGILRHARLDEALVFHARERDIDRAALELAAGGLDQLQAVHAAGLVAQQRKDQQLGVGRKRIRHVEHLHAECSNLSLTKLQSQRHSGRAIAMEADALV